MATPRLGLVVDDKPTELSCTRAIVRTTCRPRKINGINRLHGLSQHYGQTSAME